tara:strand:+ start:795 stop:998 length:204 start_codon:yes stop_codon:yes gene_type:complete
MAKMPKNIRIISKVGVVAELSFSHALNFLRLQHKQGRDDCRIDSTTLEFKNNEIVRIKSNKKDKKET